jgi:hypothetical protein
MWAMFSIPDGLSMASSRRGQLIAGTCTRSSHPSRTRESLGKLGTENWGRVISLKENRGRSSNVAGMSDLLIEELNQFLLFSQSLTVPPK